MKPLRALGLLPLALLLSCDQEPAYDRAAMFASLSDVVAIPAHEAFRADAGALADATAALCADPNEDSLAAARAAWARSRTSYKETEAFAFGPAMTLRIEGEVDFWPTRPTNVELAIQGEQSLDDAWFDAAGTSAKGLPALDYLLFDPERTDEELLTVLAEDPRRCPYVEGLGAHVARQAARLLEAWSPEGGDYRGALVNAGDGSEAFMSEHEAVSAVLNHFIATLEDVKLNRLAKPMGLTESPADPLRVESPHGGHDVADLLATLRGLRDLWTGDRDGTEGVGLDDYVASRDPELADRFTGEMDNLVGLAESIEPPLADRIREGDTRDAEQLHQALRETQRTMASEVAMTLAVTVTFTDNDGD